MTDAVCYWLLCFVPPATGNGPKIFGFAEFIAAVALLVLLYMIADIRYKFRLAITPGELYTVTFGLITTIGAETLITEVWVAEGWWVPQTAGLTKSIWQTMFGALFLTSFLTWMYYAFIRPPVFSKRNARRFAQSLYRLVLKGNDAELSVIANELARSATPLVKYSRRLPSRFHKNDNRSAQDVKRVKPGVEDYAHDVLLLVANRKLCRHIVESSPVTALAFFDSMAVEQKYDIPIGQFAKSISTEAIANKDSILYHEGDGFTSGLIGYLKPWTQTVYGNFEIVEALATRFGSPLDIDYRAMWSWDADQWAAYARCTLAAFQGHLTSESSDRHSYAIYRALQNLHGAFRDVYKLNEAIGELHTNDIFERLRAAVKFVKDAVDLIDEQKTPPSTKLRRRKDDPQKDIYDNLADLMFEILFAASSVSEPPEQCWTIHHNATWGEFFGIGTEGKAWKLVQFKLRRLLYGEVARMTEMPNYKGARILGLLLNVMGTKVTTGRQGFGRNFRPLAKAVHAWTRRSYLKLRENLPDVADAVLIGSISFDEEGSRLVKTYIKGLSKEAPREYLKLDPLPSPEKTA